MPPFSLSAFATVISLICIKNVFSFFSGPKCLPKPKTHTHTKKTNSKLLTNFQVFQPYVEVSQFSTLHIQQLSDAPRTSRGFATRLFHGIAQGVGNFSFSFTARKRLWYYPNQNFVVVSKITRNLRVIFYRNVCQCMGDNYYKTLTSTCS